MCAALAHSFAIKDSDAVMKQDVFNPEAPEERGGIIWLLTSLYIFTYLNHYMAKNEI